MVGARLVCSAGGRAFGPGWEGASAGRGGGGDGGAAVDALEACSGNASSAVIMKKAHARLRELGLSMVLSLYLRSPLGIIFFQSLDKFGGAFEEPFLRLEDRTRPMRR